MASTICNINLVGAGLNNLHEFLSARTQFTRSHMLWPLSNSFLGSSNLCHHVQKCINPMNTKPVRKKQLHWHRQTYCETAGENSVPSQHKNEENISKATLIWRAVKLPIYSVALVPLTVGTAASYLQTGVFFARRYFLLLASSALIIAWLNLSNDVYDFDTGADKNKKESVVNMVGSRTGTLVAAYVLLALGIVGLALASTEAGNIQSILLLLSAIGCGYIYQCPPFRLSYHGLGEPLCFAAFGPFATAAFYLIQGNISDVHGGLPFTSTVLSASIFVGITTTLILFCSHFHQVEGDQAVGKFSPLVRIGTRRGSQVVKVTVVALYALLFIFGWSKTIPLTCTFLCALTMPTGHLVVHYVEENYNDKAKIFMAKYYCVRLHALFGAALAIGLVAARRIWC
ncbi:UbiA prenyltransferase family [Dillenia turbinata]|uniref:UbiA prenyltransferase family n=1 Tax=Dillenia turbinata TaxID=194707 RepID=A0AAN8ZUJ4_9MAGN